MANIISSKIAVATVRLVFDAVKFVSGFQTIDGFGQSRASHESAKRQDFQKSVHDLRSDRFGKGQFGDGLAGQRTPHVCNG
jgi:hypothetical protein